jgi:hypothetical protein
VFHCRGEYDESLIKNKVLLVIAAVIFKVEIRKGIWSKEKDTSQLSFSRLA